MNKRKCQINATLPITCFSVPIIGNAELELTTDEIYKCLCCKAEVTEILENGQMVSLDFSNYNSRIEVTDSSENVVEEKVEPTTDVKEIETIVEKEVELENVVEEKVEPENVVEEKVEPTTDVKEIETIVEKEVKNTTDTVKTQVYSKNNYNHQGKNKNRQKNYKK